MAVVLEDPRRARAHARRRPARRRGARLHHAARQARRHDRRAERPLPRLHGRRAGHDSGAAQLRAAGLQAVPEVDLHLGQPRGLPRHPGRPGAEGRRHRQHRRHRDQGRLPRRHQPHVLRRRAVRSRRSAWSRSRYECMWLGIRAGAARARASATSAPRSRRTPRSTASRWCASSAATASAASSTRSRRCCTTAGRAPGWSSSRA